MGSTGGFIAVTCTRRLALISGLSCGLLAVAGCSNSSSESEIPKIDGRSFGENRDKLEEDALKAARGGRRRPKAR